MDKKRLMKDKNFFQKTLVSFAIILIVFGFFYALREAIFADYFNRAESYYAQGNRGIAAESFLFADALSEKSAGAAMKIRQAEISYMKGDFETAEKKLLEASKKYGDDPAVYRLLGQISRKAGRYDQAERYYEASYSLDPVFDVLIERMRSLVRTGRREEAIRLMKDAEKDEEGASYYRGLLSLDADSSLVLEFSQGENSEYAEKMNAIREFLDKEKRMNLSDSDYSLISKADLYNRLGETDFAMRNIEIVLSRNDNYRDAYLVLGKSLMIEGENKKAAEALEKSLALDVNNPETLFLLKEAYARSGNWEKAESVRGKYESLIR